LTEEFVAEFLNTKFPNNSFPTRLAKLIHRQTEGNPLFMVNVVDYLVDLHQIVEVDGQFKLVVPIDEVELQVPENIRHVIERHIERLTLEEQGILEGASVVGMDCSAVAIGAGLDIDVMEVEEICESLSRRRHFLLPAYIAELPDARSLLVTGLSMRCIWMFYTACCANQAFTDSRPGLVNVANLSMVRALVRSQPN
jgi:hypothetical protein